MAITTRTKTAIAGGLAMLLLSGGLLIGTALARPGQPDGQKPDATERSERADEYLSKLAGNLGVDQQKLREAIIKTREQMVDDAVKAGRLTREQGDQIKQRIRQNGGRPFFHGPHGGPAGPGGPGAGPLWGALGSAAEKALDLSSEQLRTELRAGKSLNQIATEQKKDPAKVKQALLDALKLRLDEAVKQNRLPEDRANQIKSQLSQRVDELMNRTFGQWPGSGPRGQRGARP